MSTSRTPTVGRIVHFTPHIDHSGIEGQTFAAIVAKVNDDDTLNLAVFDDAGYSFGAQNVPMVEDPAKAEAPMAYWPPVGAAAAATAKS